MHFGLSNMGSSFCHLMDQQFITLLLYLDDICISASGIDAMIDHPELVFSRLKEFHQKIKPKKYQISNTSVLFLDYVLSARGMSPNPMKVKKVRNWPPPNNANEVHSFLGLVL